MRTEKHLFDNGLNNFANHGQSLSTDRMHTGIVHLWLYSYYLCQDQATLHT
jgi:hypothetical protein